MLSVQELVRELLLREMAGPVECPIIFNCGCCSPWYTNMRAVYGVAMLRQQLVGHLVPRIRELCNLRLRENLKNQVIAGVANGATGWAMIGADRLDLPAAYINKRPKDHGKARLVDGASVSGRKVLVIEDVVTSGKSSRDAIEAVRAEGAAEIGFLSIFNYGFPESEKVFDELGVVPETLITFDDMMAAAEGITPAGDLEIVQKWHEDVWVWTSTAKSLQVGWLRSDPVTSRDVHEYVSKAGT